MDDAAWEGKVQRLSGFALEHPSAYRRRVGALAALGYAYLVGALVILIVIGVGLLAMAFVLLKLALVFLLLAFSIVRSLWVRLPAPQGIHVGRSDAPDLWRRIDEIRKQLDASRVHEVLLSDDLNAGVVQIPRIGVFGWQKNYLMIGLPLMQTLSEDEFRSVLAHELGHLSGNHSRFAGWIYRVRKTWTQLLTRLEQERRFGAGVFRKFFEWYAPYFSAYSFALARADEYTADRAAMEAAGPAAAGSGLIRLNLASAFLGTKWWPQVFERVPDEPQPPPDVYRRLAGALPAASRDADARGWLDKALTAEDTLMDTHPPLAARLEALGLDPAATMAAVADSEPPRPNAADALLGAWQDEVLARLEAEWCEAIAPEWAEGHKSAREAQAQLAELEMRAAAGSLSPEEMGQRALLTANLHEPEEAEPLLREALDRAPEDAALNFVLGKLLIARKDAGGLAYLDRAMEADPEAVLPASEIAFVFLTDEGRDEEAERYRERAGARVEDLQAAAEERQRITAKDILLPHELTPEQLETVRTALNEFPDVKVAYMARKHVDWEQSQPFFLVGIERRRQMLKPESKNADAMLIHRLAQECALPFDAYFVALGSQQKKLGKKVRSIPGAQVYSA